MRSTTLVAAALMALLFAGCPDPDPEPSPPTPTPGPLDFAVVAEGYDGGAIFSVHAGADDRVWAVGGELGRPLVLEYDGAAWTQLAPGTGQQMWWVHGFEDGSRIIVGDAGAIARYSSGSWTVDDIGMPGVTLYGVWGSSPNDVWAVGGPFQQAAEGVERRGDVVLHFDGTSWSEATLPDLGARPTPNIFKVWGTSPDNVYAVGSGGLILHYDGATWVRQEVADQGSTQLFTVTGRGPDDVWAVGGGVRGVLLHKDASGWKEVEMPEFTPQIVQGVWTAPGQPVYVSGAFGFLARLDSDGAWTVAETGTSNVLHGVTADSTGAVWAGGGTILALAANYDGTLVVAGRSVPSLNPPTPQPDASDGGPTDTVEPMDVTADTDVGPQACDPIATMCPPDDNRPFPGAPCEAGLECVYVEDARVGWNEIYECQDGEWIRYTDCPPGACGTIPLAESCGQPLMSSIAGASVRFGPMLPGQPFRDFMPGETVDLVWGGQGAPMLAYRILVEGADTVDCVNARVLTSVAGADIDASQPVTVRCGKTLTVYTIFPTSPLDCEDTLFDFTANFSVQGLGEATYALKVQGGENCFSGP